jgi:hypothetical protein
MYIVQFIERPLFLGITRVIWTSVSAKNKSPQALINLSTSIVITFWCPNQGCQIFLFSTHHHMTTKYTEWRRNTPNGRRTDQIVIKHTNSFHLKTLQKFTQFGIFGMKIFHLATLAKMCHYCNFPTEGQMKLGTSYPAQQS